MIMTKKTTCCFAVSLAVMLIAASAGYATDGTWTGASTGSQNWFVGTNWSTDPTIPNAQGDTATFANLGITADLTVALSDGTTDLPLTLGGLSFSGPAKSSSTSPSGWYNDLFLTGVSPTATLTFDNGGGGASLTSAITESHRDNNATSSGIYVQADTVLADNLTVNQNSDHSCHFIRFSNPITGVGKTLTVTGVSSAAVYWDIDRTRVDLLGNVTVGTLAVQGSGVHVAGSISLSGALTMSDGRFQINAGNTLTHTGTVTLTGGRFTIPSGSTYATDQASITVSGTNLKDYGTISWGGGTGTLAVQNGGVLRVGSATTGADPATITNITVDGTSAVGGTTAFLTARTVGTDLSLSGGAMILHNEIMAYGDGSRSPANLGTTPLYLYGAADNIEGSRFGGAGQRRDLVGGYTPWTLTVGTGSTGPWKGFGADTSETYGKPQLLQFGCPEDINGNAQDVIQVVGDVYIRTTDAVLRNAHYHTLIEGAMEVGAKLTGGGAANSIYVDGAGAVALSNKNNDIQGTWKVDGGALVPMLFGDTKALNTQNTLGNAANDIELDNGATLAFTCAAKSQEADLDAGRTITIKSGGGGIYLSSMDINWQAFGADQPFNKYGYQSAIDPDGRYDPRKTLSYTAWPSPPPWDGKGLDTLNLNGDGQLLGSGTLTKDGPGALNIIGHNTGFSGGAQVLEGTLYVDKSDSLGGTSPTVTVQAAGVYAIGYAPVAATFANVSGTGTFGIGGSYTAHIDLTTKGYFLHTPVPKGGEGGGNVTVSDVSAGLYGYRFGGAGGYLVVSDDLSGADLTIKGPGVTMLTGSNNFSGYTVDLSGGGLGIGSLNAVGTGVTIDVLEGQSLLFGNGLDAASSGKGYTVNLAGGNVGFTYDKALTNLNQLGNMTMTGTYQYLGIGAPYDSGTIDAGGVVIPATSTGGQFILLYKRGDSILDLTGNTSGNSHLATRIYDGTIRISQANQLGTGKLFLHDGGTLHVVEDLTFAQELQFGDGGKTQPYGTESTIAVDAGKTATFSGNVRIISAAEAGYGGRLRKTGEGTLRFSNIPDSKTATHAWGLTLDQGLVEVSELPYYAMEDNGRIVFRGGDIRCLASTGDHPDDVDYGFHRIHVEDGTTSTIFIDNGGLFRLTGPLNNPGYFWFGTLIVEGANETSPGANDWGTCYFDYTGTSGTGFSPDSDGTLELKSGLFRTNTASKARLPENPDFTVKLSGGRINLDTGTDVLNGHLFIDDGNALTAAPEAVNFSASSTGNTTWNGELKKEAGGTLSFSRSGGSVTTVAAGSALSIVSGTVNVGGSVDPFYDIANNRSVAINTSAGGILNINAGDVRIGAVNNSGAINVNGGILRINGAQTHASGATIPVATGAALHLNTNAGTPATGGTPAVANLTLNLAGGDVVLGATQDLGGITRTAGALNLYDQLVRLYTLDPGATEAAVRDLIQAGGIVDSLAALDEAVGYTDQRNDPYGTQYVAVRTAFKGDANMDGNVSFSDFADLLSNYGGSGKTWDLGDFNHDSNVSFADFADLLSNYGKTGGNHVPEPATLALMVLGGLGLLARRRRG